MDIKIKDSQGNFKFRVGALVINDNKVLMVENHKNGFLCTPGGHVHMGEDSKTAVAREMQEEFGVSSEKLKLVAIIENFYTNKKTFHEVCFYYLMEDVVLKQEKQKDFSCLENDEGWIINLDFKWIPLDEIDNFDIRPKEIKNILKEKNFNFKHLITRE